MRRLRRNCYCDTWARLGGRPQTADFPDGFCGLCSICGDPGHRSHHPYTVGSVSWCDRCFLIERHRAGAREPNVFFYSADDWEEKDVSPDQVSFPQFVSFFDGLRGHDSRLLIHLENGIGIDFWVRDDDTLEMSFGDPARALWGSGTVTPDVGTIAIQAALAGESLRDALRGLNTDIEYFQEHTPPLDAPG